MLCESKKTSHDRQYDMKNDDIYGVSGLTLSWLDLSHLVRVEKLIEDLGISMTSAEFHKPIQYICLLEYYVGV